MFSQTIHRLGQRYAAATAAARRTVRYPPHPVAADAPAVMKSSSFSSRAFGSSLGGMTIPDGSNGNQMFSCYHNTGGNKISIHSLAAATAASSSAFSLLFQNTHSSLTSPAVSHQQRREFSSSQQMPPWMNAGQKAPGEALAQYSTDLTQMAMDGKLDPVIGRHEEIRRTLQILARRTKNNPVLIGEPGKMVVCTVIVRCNRTVVCPLCLY
jgi:ATPases with chaperone activity, ATP-binding subunit